jgi:hypothetical protein
MYTDGDSTSKQRFLGPGTRHSDECSPLLPKQVEIVTNVINCDKWWVIVGDGIDDFDTNL